MNSNPAPIVTVSERLLLEIEAAVCDFPRKHRYALGADLRKWAMDASLLAQEAWRATKNRQHQAELLARLAQSNDRLKLGLQTAHRLNAFTSTGRFNDLIVMARDVGRQAGAWSRQLAKHLQGQNQAASAQPERARTLSAPAASSEANR